MTLLGYLKSAIGGESDCCEAYQQCFSLAIGSCHCYHSGIILCPANIGILSNIRSWAVAFGFQGGLGRRLFETHPIGATLTSQRPNEQAK